MAAWGFLECSAHGETVAGRQEPRQEGAAPQVSAGRASRSRRSWAGRVTGAVSPLPCRPVPACSTCHSRAAAVVVTDLTFPGPGVLGQEVPSSWGPVPVQSVWAVHI